MSASDTPLDGKAIRRHLRQVADLIAAGAPRRDVLVVGGSLLALRGLRLSTLDVDTVLPLDDQLRAAIAEVARRHGLARSWLNDSCAVFRPQTLHEHECEVLLDHPRLRVLGAPLRQVFVMKLFAARVRTRDYDDLVALWPACDFASAEDAVELYRAAYPHEAHDPYLVDFVRALGP